MNNHFLHLKPPERLTIPLHSESRSYHFEGFRFQDVVLGSYKAFDFKGNALNFADRSLYLPLSDSFPSLEFAALKQVHGTSITRVRRMGIPFSNHGKGDALATSDTDLGLTIRTADCLPLFLFSQSQVILAHVGYRGLLDGILLNLEQEILEKGEKEIWNAAIGSHIGICCFQVTGPVLEQFNAFSLARSHDIIGPENARFVSLKNLVFHWFQQVSGGRSCFDFSTCTHCRLEQHSYRRSKTANRLGHVIFRESKTGAGSD